MELAGAALGNHGDDAAVGAAVLGVEGGTDDLGLLNRVDAGGGNKAAPIAGGGGDAVDEDEAPLAASSVERETVVVLVGGGAGDAGADGGDAGGGVNENERVAGVDGELGDHGGGESNFFVGRLGINADGGSFHLNALADVAEGELGVDFGHLGGLEIDGGDLIFFEALHLDFEAVGAGGELGEVIEAVLIGENVSGIVSGVVLEVDLRAGEGGAGGVGDDAGDVTGEGLGEGEGGAQ